MILGIDPKVDYAFKRVFGDERKASLNFKKGLPLIAVIADVAEEDESLPGQLLELADKMEGEDGVLLLYAVVKKKGSSAESVGRCWR